MAGPIFILLTLISSTWAQSPPSTNSFAQNSAPIAFRNITCLQSTRTDEDQLCIYTSSSFWHGRGMSMFTNDITLRTLHEYPIIDSRDVLPSVPTAKERMYELKEMPGKGMSGVARRDIEAGTTILAEHPALMIHSPDDGRDNDEDRTPLYRVMVATLPEPVAEGVLGLSAHVGAEYLVDAVINTNAFAVDVGMESHKAVFTEISRFNHDCRPNAEYTWSEGTLSMHVRASRPIRAGEEISISYIDQSLPTTPRKEKLTDGWGFTCSCHFCSLPPALATESDERVAEMGRILSLLDSPEPAMKVSVESLIERYITLANLERLPSRIPDAYVATARIFGAKVFSSPPSPFPPATTTTSLPSIEYRADVRKALNYTSLSIRSGINIMGGHWDVLEEMTELARAMLEVHERLGGVTSL